MEDEYVPKPWTKGIDQHGQPYYVNSETGQIRRQPPVTAGFSSYQKNSAFIDPEQWDIVIETMASTIHPQQQLRIFQKLKKIAEKMITKDDPKYRTLYLNNPKLQHTVLAFDGGLEFLYNLGFEPHVTARDKLVCHEVNSRVVQACLICLEDKIEVLSYDAYEQDNANQQYLNGGNIGGGGGASINMGGASYQPPPANNLQPHNELLDPYPYNTGSMAYPYGSQQMQQPLNTDKEQVMMNLTGLGFGGNNQQQKPFQSPMQQRYPPYSNPSDFDPQQQYQDHMNSSDAAYLNKNGKKEPKRPVPPPPISGRNPMNPMMDYHDQYGSGGVDQFGQVRDSTIERNVYGNMNKGKIDDLMGLEKHRKMYKTFIFIRHGNSIWNKFKAGGKKRKMAAILLGMSEYLKTKSNPENHADTWVVDAPLSRVGIDEAYGLSKFLGRHLTLRQFESLADLEHHQSLATPIKDALRLVKMGVLEKYEDQLAADYPDLIEKCRQIESTLEDAHRQIQNIMLQTEARRGGNNAQIQSKAIDMGMGPIRAHVTKGGDFIPDEDKGGGGAAITDDPVSNSNNGSPQRFVDEPVLQHGGSGVEDNVLLMDDEKAAQHEANARPFSHVVIANAVENVEEQDDLEMPLEIEWVLDQMVDSLGDSIVVTSNLRRAISTAVIALWDRFSTTKECIHILPCLQELGMNVDTHTPILEAQVPQVSSFEKTSKKLNVQKLTEFYGSRLKVEQALGALGKKSMRETGSETQQRLKFFCDWAFKKNSDDGTHPINTIIACGHSHWMRAFFRHFLPKDTTSMAGKMKIQNCGVVGFRMICTIGPENTREYEIIGKSITPIYRGFV